MCATRALRGNPRLLHRRSIALASTFYPGTTAPSQAAVLAVGKGQERSGIDFTLQVVPTAHVDGAIVCPRRERCRLASRSA